MSARRSTKLFMVLALCVQLLPNLTVAGSPSDVIVYTYNSKAQPNSDAASWCAANGGMLALPKSQQEYDNLMAFIADVPGSGSQIWMGMHRDKDKLWSWTDGSAVTWFKWDLSANEPSKGSTEDCVRIYMAAKAWRDAACHYNFPSVCQTLKPISNFRLVRQGVASSNPPIVPEVTVKSRVHCAALCKQTSKCRNFTTDDAKVTCKLYGSGPMKFDVTVSSARYYESVL